MIIALKMIAKAIAGYLLGSINSAVIFSKTVYRCDIRKQGSGNAGMTNMLRVFGKKAAALTFIGDFLKGILAVVLGMLLNGTAGAAGTCTLIAGDDDGRVCLSGTIGRFILDSKAEKVF